MLQLLLKPGLEIIGRLSITRKFLLIFILYLFPVGYVAYYAISKHQAAIAATQEELEHLELVNAFKPLFVNTAKSRGLTNAYLNGNESARSEISGVQALIDSQFSSITNHPVFEKLSAELKGEVSTTSTSWKELKSDALNLEADASFDRHSNLVADLHATIKSIREQSTLMIDSEAHTSFLINSFVSELPLIVEITGQTRGMGAGIAAKGSFSADTFIALSNYYKQLMIAQNAIKRSFDGAFGTSNELSSLQGTYDTFNQAVESFLKTTKSRLLDPDKIEISSNEYFSQGTQVVEKTLSLYDATYQQLKKSLNQRKGETEMEVLINILSSIALLIGAIYLFACFSKNILNSINRVKECVNAVADGDLTVKVEIQSNDEMKTIGDDINKMIENTKSLVCKVLSATNDLVDTAEQNNQSSVKTSERISQQNIEVEQVATAMNQMSATVQEVANNAEQTASSTASADTDSKAGYRIVQSTIDSISELANELSNASSSIHELQASVDGIGSVLDVIQGIADQTNLLALNAAIEAARAGESGRGFAVVADEVRTLASKTQESTEEIRHMIDKLQTSASLSVKAMNSGNDKSQQTVGDAQKAGDALKQISESVGHISLMGEQIASAATQQTSVADEINRSIMSVKEISELTGQAAQDSAENSQFLNDVAANLKALVAQFRV
ncbi:methyl-accepting chemotaxis protein [Aliikangiella coralliicola]|uniref:Methyl-accepting chemotaxis protein n=1 Tax=Aliikangiella coralliicola TaxID=2592383 RepID=A0A545UAQ6_9GAMM|nr:methyl-accepting chemotaxis protein [Aliikangiella coralliicola]TQV86545.1 methyl-accepting chemotaxis protein [Aliikangiella coralliicola]